MNNNNLPPAFVAGLEPFGRRNFLRFALVSGTVVLSGCANLMSRFGRKQEAEPVAAAEPVPELIGADQALTPTERAVFEKLVAALLPVEKNGFLDTKSIPVMANIEGMVRTMPPFIRQRMNLAIAAFDTGSILLTFRFRRFSALSDEEALMYVNAWHEGTFIQRGAITSLKVLVCVNYWRDQRAAAKIDYDGPVTEKWGVPRLGNQLLPRT